MECWLWIQQYWKHLLLEFGTPSIFPCSISRPMANIRQRASRKVQWLVVRLVFHCDIILLTHVYIVFFLENCIICAMTTTLIATQRQNYGSFTPSAITSRLSQICRHLRLGHQEDAHEFLRYLIEKMEKSFLSRFRNEPWFKDLEQYSKETTPLNQILGGYLRSTVTCLACRYESVTFQHFQDLPLDISKVQTLNEAIAGYFSRENLEECGYKCEACKKKVSASKKFSLERAPTALCIQLKRFTAMGGKMSKHIQISEKLNLQKYMTSDSNQNCLYRLVSMITHLGGSSGGGHYTGNFKIYNLVLCFIITY